MGLDVWSEFKIWMWVKKPLQMIRVSGEGQYLNIFGELDAKRLFQSEARKILTVSRKSNVVSFYWRDHVNG